MTTRYTDDQLRAFLEGTLEDDALIDAIEAAINAEPAVAARAEALALEDDAVDAVRDAFAPVLDAPVPEHLAQIVAAPARADVVERDSGRTLPTPANDTGSGWRWPQFAAVAASLALGVLIGGPLLTGGAGGGSDSGTLGLAGADGAAVAAPVAAMLDTVPSGRTIDFDGLGSGEVVLTFRNLEGELCRQFTLEGAAGTSDALACTSGEGWQLEAFGRRAEPVGEMQLAGGDAAVGVVAAVDAMIDSDPLVGADEAAELARK